MYYLHFRKTISGCNIKIAATKQVDLRKFHLIIIPDTLKELPGYIGFNEFHVMKTTCKYLYDLSLIMTLLMLCQSCVAYHRTPVSLEQAVQAKTGSKVFTADGSFAKYRYITEIDGKFYGVKKSLACWWKYP